MTPRTKTIAARCRACVDICPTKRFSRALPISMRGAAFPISLSSTKVRSRANFVPRSAIASMAAMIALPFARGTNSRRSGATRNSPRATRLRAPTLADLVRLDDAAFRALFSKTADQARRPRPFCPQRADCDRQLRRRRRLRLKPSACSTTRRLWCAAPRYGRYRDCCRRSNLQRWQRSNPKTIRQ